MSDQDGISVKDATGWVTRHFAAISAGAFVFGVMISALFTVGYLSVFNPSLIWIINYQDILKIGLIISSIGLASLFFFQQSVYAILDMFFDKYDRKNSKVNFYIFIFVVTVALSISVYVSSSRGEHDMVMQRVTMGIIISLSILLLWSVQTSRKKGRIYDVANLVGFLGIFALIVTMSGVYFGYRLKNNVGHRQTIFLDDRVIYGAEVVLFTEKYAVLYQSDKSVAVYPSSRVREILGKSGDLLDFLSGG